MKDQQAIIRLLNLSADTGGAVSGTAIGEALGISRMAVQKRVQALIANGLPITAVSGKGYALAKGINLLSDERIARHLSSELCESIEVLQSIESTNSHLLSQEILSGRAKICVAESQSAGRGRRGNDWQSAPYRNVMLSLSWGFDHWPETITGLGLAVSLVLTKTINERYGLDVKIKWPNDLMVGYDKLAGILIDVAGESSGSCNVVVGVGLNVHQPDWSPKSSAYRWVDMQSLVSGTSEEIDRNELIGLVAHGLSSMFAEFAQSGFAPMVEDWNALSSYRSKRVRVGSPDEYIEGVMVGVDDVGALLICDHEDKLHRFVDSNMSVRLLENEGAKAKS